MKKIILITTLLGLCSVGRADDCKGDLTSQYLQEAFMTSAMAKNVQARVSTSPYASISENTGREICFLDGSIATHLDRLSDLAGSLSSSNKMHLVQAETEQIRIGSYCHSNLFSGIQSLSPKAIFESAQTMASELDQILKTP